MKLRCTIQGIDCPHCALELEGLMSKSDDFIKATINYPMQSLVLEVADDADEDVMLEKAQAIADQFSDGIEIDFRD